MIDNKIFEIMDVYIFKFVIYRMIAYILPMILDIKILINLVFIFKIIAAAYKMILFMITFSKKITSKYIVIFITFFLFIYCTTKYLKILSFFSMNHNYLKKKKGYYDSLSHYIFLFLFFLKNAGMSKSPCEELSVDAGIEFIFLSHVLFTNVSTLAELRASGFSNPVAMTVI